MPAPKKRTAIYMRVSSRQQDEAAQKLDLANYSNSIMDQFGKIHKPLVFADKATGTTMNRPGWNELWSRVEAGEIGQIAVWRMDRLGRTASGLTKLFDDLQARKINLISLKDGLDLNTPAGRLMANVLASVAQFETEVRSERQLAGIAAAKAAGKTWGGSEKGRRIKVTPEQIAVVRRMKSEGESVIAMASATGLSRPTIYAIIKNQD